MPSAPHYGRVSPLLVAVVCTIAMLAAALPALADARMASANARPDGWLVNYGQSSFTVPETYQAHYARGQELMLAGDYEAAAGELLTCIKLVSARRPAPSSSARLLRGGWMTVDRLRTETYLLPLASAAVSLGHCLQELGRLDTAILLYTGAADVAPAYAAAHYSLGQALLAKGWARHLERVARTKGIGEVTADDEELHLYRRAIAHLHVARQLEPSNVDVQLALSTGLRRWGLLDGAVSHAQKATELEPTNAQAHYELGLGLSAMGQLSAAARAFKDALSAAKGESDAFQAEINNALGTAQAGMGNMEEAIAAYRKAATLAPDNAAYQNNLAAALRNDGKPSEAATLHHAATVFEPGSIAYYLNLATAACDAGDLTSAIQAYRNALRLNSTDPELHPQLGVTLYPTWPPCKNLPAWAAEIHHQLGVTLYRRSDLGAAIGRFAMMKPEELKRGDVEGALAAIEMHFMRAQRVTRVDAMDPRCYEATPRLAMSPNPWPELDAQMARLWAALEVQPLHGTTRLTMQRMAADTSAVAPVVMNLIPDLGKVLQVKTSAETAAMPVGPTAPAAKGAPEGGWTGLSDQVKAAVVAMGTALQRSDDLQEAIAELKWARCLDPSSPLIANNLGKALYDAARVPEALAMFDTALRLSPDIPETHFNRGVALASLCRMDQAMAAWQRALDLHMEDVRLYTFLAIGYIQKTELAYAKAMLLKALGVKKDFAPANYYMGLVEALMQCASPLTAEPLDSSRLSTKLGKPSYDVRAEFIRDRMLSDAREALLAAETADPDRKSLYYYVGVELGLQDPALSSLKGLDVIHCVASGQGLQPDWAAVSNNMGVLQALEGNLTRAEELLRIAIADEPEYALAHWNLGRVLVQQGKVQEGRAEIALATELAARQHLDYYFLPATVPTAQAVAQVPTPVTVPVPRPPARLPLPAAEESSGKTLLEAFDYPDPVL